MRKLLLIILILQSTILIAQKNRFNIELGANYPLNLVEENLAREFGIDIGFNYSRVFLDKGIFETGITLDIYEQFSWEENRNVGIYIPVQLGYVIGKIELIGGMYYDLLTIHYVEGSNQTLYSYWDDSYYDLNSNYINKNLFGFNISLSYNIGIAYSAYIDFKDCGFLNTKNLGKHYNYLLTTIGLKYYFKS